MEYKGRVQGGVVVLPSGNFLREGLEVRVVSVDTEDALPTLAERFRNVAGKAEGLPSDLAERHDYYLHGKALESGT